MTDPLLAAITRAIVRIERMSAEARHEGTPTDLDMALEVIADELAASAQDEAHDLRLETIGGAEGLRDLLKYLPKERPQ